MSRNVTQQKIEIIKKAKIESQVLFFYFFQKEYNKISIFILKKHNVYVISLLISVFTQTLSRMLLLFFFSFLLLNLFLLV